MKYVLDILFILILALVTVISTKRGFVRSVWASVTLIGSLALSYAFGPVLGDYFCINYILPAVTDFAFETINGMLIATEGNYNLSELFSALPEEFILLAERCGADIDSLQEQFASAISIPQEQVYDFARSIALPVSQTISRAVGIVAIFFSTLIVLVIVGILFKIIAKIPVIKTLDGIFGFVFGLIKGLVVICILCVVIALIIEFHFLGGKVSTYFLNLTEYSCIFKLFCTLSPVDFINIG